MGTSTIYGGFVHEVGDYLPTIGVAVSLVLGLPNLRDDRSVIWERDPWIRAVANARSERLEVGV